MARSLLDGEQRMIGSGKGREYKVIAERVDFDTPLIHLYKGDHFLCTLTDSDACQLIKDVEAALSILPTSK